MTGAKKKMSKKVALAKEVDAEFGGYQLDFAADIAASAATELFPDRPMAHVIEQILVVLARFGSGMRFVPTFGIGRSELFVSVHLDLPKALFGDEVETIADEIEGSVVGLDEVEVGLVDGLMSIAVAIRWPIGDQIPP